MASATIPIYGIRLVREGHVRARTRTRKQAINNAADIAALLRSWIRDRDRETFVVAFLSVRHELVGVHVAHIGTLDSAPTHPREVFKAAILANAACVVLAHNHPSGHPEPSMDDVRLTLGLADAGRILGVTVLDHVVVGDRGYVSMRERGILRE